MNRSFIFALLIAGLTGLMDVNSSSAQDQSSKKLLYCNAFCEGNLRSTTSVLGAYFSMGCKDPLWLHFSRLEQPTTENVKLTVVLPHEVLWSKTQDLDFDEVRKVIEDEGRVNEKLRLPIAFEGVIGEGFTYDYRGAHLACFLRQWKWPQ